MSFWNSPGLLAAVLASLAGVGGAAVGIVCSLNRSRSSAERRAVGRWSAWFVAIASLQVFGVLILPDPWRHFLWLVYAPVLTLSIHRCNRALDQLRRQNEGV